jgi:hypothetical protein
MEELVQWAKKYKDTHPEKFYEIWDFISSSFNFSFRIILKVSDNLFIDI